MSHTGVGAGGRRPMIVHRDVFSKLFALLVIITLGMAAVQVAHLLPPREVTLNAGVAEARRVEEAGGNGSGSAEVEVRGLSYIPPRGDADGRETGLAALREAGKLKGYSIPPNRLAFEPDGKAVFLPSSPVIGGPVKPRTVYSGSDTAKACRRIALTFDSSDVSEPSAKRIIDELTRLRAPATLFVCGQWCVANPELARTASERGFEIASHSFNHPDFRKLTNEQITSQLDATEQAFRDATGASMAAYFRPPYGGTDSRVAQVAADNGYTVAMWNRDTRDWAGVPMEAIRDTASSGVEGGEIVLMHMTAPHTAEALAEIVTNLRARGFELTTLSGVLLQ